MSRRAFLGDAGWFGASAGLATVAQFAAQIVAAAALLPAEFGRYAAALAVTSVVEAVIVGRSGDAGLRSILAAWPRGRQAAAAATRQLRGHDAVSLPLAAMLGLGLAVASAPWLHISVPVAAVLLIAIPLQIGYGADKAALSASAQARTMALADVLSALIAVAATIAGVLAFGLWGLVVAVPVAALGKVLLYRQLAGRLIRALPAGPAEPVAALPQVGLGEYLRGGATQLLQSADTLCVSALAGEHAVGLYRVARLLAGLPWRVLQPLLASNRLRLLGAWQRGDRPAVHRSLGTAAALALAVGGLGALGLALSSAWLIPQLFGTAYALPAAAVVPLACAYTLFAAAYHACTMIAPLAHDVRTSLLASLLACAGFPLAFAWAGETPSALGLAAAAAFTGAAVVLAAATLRIVNRPTIGTLP